MIKYSSDMNIDDLKNSIKEEIKYIEAFIGFQKSLKEYISVNFDSISLMNDKDCKNQNEISSLLQPICEIRLTLDCNCIKLQTLLQTLKILKHTEEDCLKKEIKKYNQNRRKTFSEVTPNTKKAKKIAVKLFRFLKENNKNAKNTEISCVPYFELTPISDNYILKISEKNQMVYLPYLVEDLKEILNNNPTKYSSMKDLIDKKYTIPIKYYKNSSYARFRESYKLIREKEHGSINQALNLAFELFLNYNLNPAVISACKNIDELDIYLNCLEENELDDFYCFEIQYEIPPMVVKNKKNETNPDKVA